MKIKQIWLATLLALPVYANADIINVTNLGPSDPNNIFIGEQTANGSSNIRSSIFFGISAAANATNVSDSICIGEFSCAAISGISGVTALGLNAGNAGAASNSTLIGINTFAVPGSTNATAIGSGANVGVRDAFGTYTGPASGGTATGFNAHAGNINATANGAAADADGVNSVSVGATSFAGTQGTSIGANTKTTGTGSTSIGFGSTDNGVNNVVSFGNDGSGGGFVVTRKLINVGAGAMTATSTDAVNGSQLFAVNQTANAALAAAAGGTPIDTSTLVKTDGSNAMVGNLNLGTNQITNMADGVNIHDASTVGQMQNAVDQGVATSNSYTDSRIAGLTTGGGAPQDLTPLLARDGSRPMTGNLQMGSNQISGLKDGTQATDASTVGQMQAFATGLVHQTNGIETGNVSVAATQASLTVTNSLGNTHGIIVDTTHTIISGGTTSTSLTLDNSGATLANVATGGPAQLHGVAPGTSGTDAVNLNQLNSAITSFGGGGNPADIKRLDGRIDNLSAALRKVAKRAYGGAALAMATAAATPVQAGETQLSFGIGNFNGESALAVSVYKATESGNAVVGFGGGITSSGDIGFRGTITFAWNPTLDDNSESK